MNEIVSRRLIVFFIPTDLFITEIFLGLISVSFCFLGVPSRNNGRMMKKEVRGGKVMMFDQKRIKE